MNDKKIPRVDLPAGVRPATLALREGLPPTQWGENSEARCAAMASNSSAVMSPVT